MQAHLCPVTSIKSMVVFAVTDPRCKREVCRHQGHQPQQAHHRQNACGRPSGCLPHQPGQQSTCQHSHQRLAQRWQGMWRRLRSRRRGRRAQLLARLLARPAAAAPAVSASTASCSPAQAAPDLSGEGPALLLTATRGVGARRGASGSGADARRESAAQSNH